MQCNRKKILLVDDNPVNLKLARNTLMDLYDVFTVPSAEKLFVFLERTLPDMILLDVLMPGIDGYEAMQRLMRDDRTKQIPVIFLTSKTDTGSEMEGLSLGAVDYITKPFVPQLLLKRVETHMLMEAQKEELKYINANLERIVREKTSAVVELQNAVLATVSELVECRDDVTGGHVERTAHTMRRLVRTMMDQGVYLDELASWDIELFLQSSQLHDVGKISIHDNILLKPAKLTDEEFEEMKNHAIFGEEIIDRIQRNTQESAFLTHAKIMAGSHHEKWDGSGYPRGMRGENIPLQGRIMAIADVYDALVSKRPYKEPFSHEKAMQIMRESRGNHFDPAILDAFISAFVHLVHSA
ncbi:MAG: response regulator [Clostridiales Family XIII bacterium]|jgi:putative two-component system response regulator|nr:response regulator [Clostridiales Family XIII bacterium]